MILEYGTDPIVHLKVQDNQANLIEDIAYDDSNLEIVLTPIGGTSETLTLVQGILGTYIPNSWIQLTEKGRYQLCLPTLQPDTRYEIKTTYLTYSPQRGYVDVVELDRNSFPTEQSEGFLELAEASQTYGPKRIKTKELEVEQFDPKTVQKVQERSNIKTKDVNFSVFGGVHVKPSGSCRCG